MCVCVCVCVREREREKQRQKGRDRHKKSQRETLPTKERFNKSLRTFFALSVAGSFWHRWSPKTPPFTRDNDESGRVAFTRQTDSQVVIEGLSKALGAHPTRATS